MKKPLFCLCHVDDQTSGIAGTGTSNYICRIAEHFNADLALLAWSGKGMFRNCCDPGEKMPAYWQQTLGGSNHTAEWDHLRFVPDVMVINLGTNDSPSGAPGICPNKNFLDANHWLRPQRGEGLTQPEAASLRGARPDELRGGGKYEHNVMVTQ